MIFRKLKSKRGETLVETLVAILVITLCMAFLVNSAVTASKLNDAADKEYQKLNFSYENAVQTPAKVTLTYGQGGTTNINGSVLIDVTEYEDGGLYCYE